MSLFFGKKKKVEAVLFSPIEGNLTFNGNPASGAKIKLWLAWKDNQGEILSFSTDDSGNFSIPAQTILYKPNPFAQMSIGQKIIVELNQHEYLIWMGGKTSINLYGELGGQPKNLTCELMKENMDTHLEHALIETRCVWDHITLNSKQ